MPVQTKKIIMKSFYNQIQKKNFEKITVRDIVDECGINRKTFYYYFKDIYDLFECFFREQLEEFGKSLPDDFTLEEAITGIFEICESNKKAVFHIGAASDEELKKCFNDILNDTIAAKYRSKAQINGVSKNDFVILCDFMVMGFLGMFSKWVECGMKEDYRDDIKRFCIIFDRSIGKMLDNAKSSGLHTE